MSYPKDMPNGQTITIEGPISVITVDNKNYEIVDDVARNDITSIQDDLNSVLSPSGSSEFKDALKDAVIDMLYPVGSIYLSMNDEAPFDHGDWSRIGQGKALVGVNPGVEPFNTTGAEAGSANAIIPYHRHSVSGGSHTHSLGSHTHDMADSKYRFPVTTAPNIISESVYRIPNGSWEMVQIVDKYQWASVNNKTSGPSTNVTGAASLPSTYTTYEGQSGNTTNANYQPSVAVSVWQRVS